MNRTGKIARLPRAIRDQLNRRLDDGEPATHLAAWLNAQPEVRTVLAAHFGGQPINDSNLTAWKQGGFLDWQRHQEACAWVHALSDEADQLTQESAPLPLSDRLSPLVSLAIGRLLRELTTDTLSDESRRRDFLTIVKELSHLRRDDHEAARLRIELDHHAAIMEIRQRGKNASPDHSAGLR